MYKFTSNCGGWGNEKQTRKSECDLAYCSVLQYVMVCCSNVQIYTVYLWKKYQERQSMHTYWWVPMYNIHHIYTIGQIYTPTQNHTYLLKSSRAQNTHARPSVNICIFKIYTDAHMYTPIQIHTYLWKSSRARKHEYTSAARAFPDNTICRCFPESE